LTADASERLVNLAMYLAAAREPVTADQVRAEVDGYPEDQDDAAFLRMFERDKDDLRASGFALTSDAEGQYAIDAEATFASSVSIAPDEAAVLHAVGGALLEDPGFPFGEDLRLALSKLATAVDPPDAPVRTLLTDEAAAAQGHAAAQLNGAVAARKRVSFGYTNSRGERHSHEVEPYGLFLRDGRWYVVGRDVVRDDVRVYAAVRIENLSVNPSAPKTTDFERPRDFDVASFIALPFQYGSEETEGCLHILPSEAWRAPALAGGSGSLEALPDGSVEWRVTVRDSRRLLTWIVENGPGIVPISPTRLAEEMAAALQEVADLHG